MRASGLRNASPLPTRASVEADPPALAAGLPEAGALALVGALLVARHLRFDPADPRWPDRDRLVLADARLAALPARLGGRPEMFDALAESPAQALAAGLGMALAERLLASRFGRSLVDHRSWVLLDGADLACGAAQEAAAAAASLGLDRLTVIATVGRGAPCFAGPGWNLRQVEAADAPGIDAALSAATRARRPTLIAIRGGAGEPSEPCAWPEFWQRGASARRAWLRRLHRHSARGAFERAMAGGMPPGWQPAIAAPGPQTASAQAVSEAIARLAALLPELGPRPAIGAQAMGGATVGMALHGGVRPVAASTLAEAEPAAPALRLAAARGLPTVHLLHEPESACPVGGMRANWRAMARLHVYRPASAEALACLELAFRRTDGPSLLLLNAHAAGPGGSPRDLRAACARGGYILADPARGPRQLTLIASGPELPVALAARDLLAGGGLAAAVVSLPCWELFAQQSETWREAVLGEAPRFGIEAGSGFGWERWLGRAGEFIGPAADGSLTPERVEEMVRKRLPAGNFATPLRPPALATARGFG